jgi:hypothetical protein
VTHRPVLLLAVAVAAGVLCGCSTHTVSQPPPAVPTNAQAATQTPEAVVLAYWRAVGRHDYKAMDALSTARWRGEFADTTPRWPEPAVKFDMSNLRIASELPWDGSGRPDYLSSYAALREYTVKYVQSTDSQTEEAGDQMRFVIVAQETTGGPWRVDGSGTGP